MKKSLHALNVLYYLSNIIYSISTKKFLVRWTLIMDNIRKQYYQGMKKQIRVEKISYYRDSKKNLTKKETKIAWKLVR